MKSLKELTRPNIHDLAPYSCARNEFSGKDASVFLDANENPFNTPLNRYPDPLQLKLKEKIEQVKGIPAAYTFVGNGSDEAIDLLYRCFCRPRKDNVVAIEPTYGMYRVCADINDVEYRPVLLDEHFQMSADALLSASDQNTKVIWICSPNNPTGNDMQREEVLKVIDIFEGLVVVDEAYSDFSQLRPLRFELPRHPNLVVLNTLSKAWGAAAIRLGMAFASPDIIAIFNKVKYPYNVNLLTQEKAISVLSDRFEVDRWVQFILQERDRMVEAFRQLPVCKQVYPTNANFFLAHVSDAQSIYEYLVERGIIVRNRTRVQLCHNCLRITIGTRAENAELMGAMRLYGHKE
ncbi:MAG: histidinol-phosphate transaminase [Prevotella sp.]|nr:histidinol-phosphate transaminase [Prevotella sp.]